MDAPWLQAAADHAVGAVAVAEGDHIGALTHLHAAQVVWRGMGAPYESARTRALAAAACRALGDDDGAELELGAALAAFERLGAAPDAARAPGRWPALGSPRPRRALTARERQVLALVATGRTNRAVGAELHISDKTVARHLSNIFAKLGLSSRCRGDRLRLRARPGVVPVHRMTHRRRAAIAQFARCGAGLRRSYGRRRRGRPAEPPARRTRWSHRSPPDPTPTAPVLGGRRRSRPAPGGAGGRDRGGPPGAPDLIAELREAGCFRMLLPRSHGGDELDLVSAMQVLEELARADGSVGWIVAIGSAGWLDLCDLPRSTFDALYADGPLVTAGVFAPSGTAEPVDGGYRIRGRWGFASGCEHADLLYGNCIDAGDGGGGPVGGGPPPMRIAVFAPDQVTIEDTWRVSGLRGTGSHHIVVDDVVVPAERTYPVMRSEACVDVALTRIPLPTPLTPPLASMAVGIAQGALDDVLGLAERQGPAVRARGARHVPDVPARRWRRPTPGCGPPGR